MEIDRLLDAINQRLVRLYDHDHQIGHAYFLPLREEPTLDNLRRIFKHRILPLLQEYFHNDWGKIGLVLGDRFVREQAPNGAAFAAFDDPRLADLQERRVYRLSPVESLTAADFRSIYA